MKQYTLLVLNTLTLAVALVANYLSGTGYFGGATVGEISAQYENLFTPAGYAFGIWGLIYLMLIAFVAHQWYAWVNKREDRELKQTGIWFMLGNLFNAGWIVAWLNGYIGVSVILTLLILTTLLVLMFRLRLETWNAPVRIIVFVWWPLAIYLGWAIVAFTANVAVYLTSIDWGMAGIPEPAWAMTMIIVAAIIYVFLVFTRNLRESAAVGIWALIAIAVKQWPDNQAVAVTAVIMSGILFLVISWHAYRNRKALSAKREEVSGKM